MWRHVAWRLMPNNDAMKTDVCNTHTHKKSLVSYAVTTKCVSIIKPHDNKKAVNKTKTNIWSSSRPITNEYVKPVTNEYVKPITNEYVKPVTNDITKLVSLCLTSKFGSHGNQINPKASNTELNVHETSSSCMYKLICLWCVCVCVCVCVFVCTLPQSLPSPKPAALYCATSYPHWALLVLHLYVQVQQMDWIWNKTVRHPCFHMNLLHIIMRVCNVGGHKTNRAKWGSCHCAVLKSPSVVSLPNTMA